MTSLYVGLVIVLVAPLLLASWRTSLLCFALQGLLMGWLVLEAARPPSIEVFLLLLDFLLLRGLIVPMYLYRAQLASRRDEVLRSGLSSWALAGATVFLALRFGRVLGGANAALATHLFVATAAFLLGLLVLGTQTNPLSQIIGVLRIENAIALFELSAPESPPLPIQVGLLVIFVFTVATFVRFIPRLSAFGSAPSAATEELTL